MPVRDVALSMEMTDLEQLLPPARIAEVSLTPTPSRSWVIKPLHDKVAGPNGWQSVNWSAEQWRRRLINPRVRFATILAGTQTAGLVEFESQPEQQVEITMFGVVPEYRESGLVAYAFSLATEAAWSLPDARDKSPLRVWLRVPAHEDPAQRVDYSALGYTVVGDS